MTGFLFRECFNNALEGNSLVKTREREVKTIHFLESKLEIFEIFKKHNKTIALQFDFVRLYHRLAAMVDDVKNEKKFVGIFVSPHTKKKNSFIDFSENRY